MAFNGLGMNLGNLSRLSNAQTRSISAENMTGERGRGGMATDGPGAPAASELGVGWKMSPCVIIQPGETFTIADIRDQGAIQQIWMTPSGHWRFAILRIYWDDQKVPSVECPVGDFFAAGWGDHYAQVSSLPVCVNPRSGLNCYWEMPFRSRCLMTIENIDKDAMSLFYQVNYTLTEVPEDCAYFHASFRRANPQPYKEPYTVIDGIEGKGHYVGTYFAWGVNNNGWWGEGEMKFYMDGEEWPTICGTGFEDYICGSYNFDVNGRYTEFTTPYSGMPQVIRPDGLYNSQQRFGLYRWHIMDPIRFEHSLKVTVQDLGWRRGGKYLPQQSDIASVAYWYQTLPTAPFRPLPDKEHLEII